MCIIKVGVFICQLRPSLSICFHYYVWYFSAKSQNFYLTSWWTFLLVRVKNVACRSWILARWCCLNTNSSKLAIITNCCVKNWRVCRLMKDDTVKPLPPPQCRCNVYDSVIQIRKPFLLEADWCTLWFLSVIHYCTLFQLYSRRKL